MTVVIPKYPGKSDLSSISNRLHFGIGNVKKVDSVIIYWPNNKVSNYTNLKTNENHKIKFEDKNVKNFKIRKHSKSTLKLKETELFKFKHNENNFIDFNIHFFSPRFKSNITR